MSKYSTIDTAYFQQPYERVALSQGSTATQPTVAMCLCPLDKVIGKPFKVHPGTGAAWGQCPSNECGNYMADPLKGRTALTRYQSLAACRPK